MYRLKFIAEPPIALASQVISVGRQKLKSLTLLSLLALSPQIGATVFRCNDIKDKGTKSQNELSRTNSSPKSNGTATEAKRTVIVLVGATSSGSHGFKTYLDMGYEVILVDSIGSVAKQKHHQHIRYADLIPRYDRISRTQITELMLGRIAKAVELSLATLQPDSFEKVLVIAGSEPGVELAGKLFAKLKTSKIFGAGSKKIYGNAYERHHDRKEDWVEAQRNLGFQAPPDSITLKSPDEFKRLSDAELSAINANLAEDGSVVVKPTNSSGSFGVKIASSLKQIEGDIQNMFSQRTKAGTEVEAVQVQKNLLAKEGKEGGVNGIAWKDPSTGELKVLIVSVQDYKKHPPQNRNAPPYDVSRTLLQGTAPDGQLRSRMIQAAYERLKALFPPQEGNHYFPFHIEVYTGPNGSFSTERIASGDAAVRPIGAEYTRYNSLGTQGNVHEFSLIVQAVESDGKAMDQYFAEGSNLGEVPSEKHSWVLHLNNFGKSAIFSVGYKDRYDQIKKSFIEQGGEILAHFESEPGDRIAFTEHLGNRLGTIAFAHQNPAVLARVVEQMKNEVAWFEARSGGSIQPQKPE